MAGMARAATHSHVTVVVAVKWTVDLDSRTYSEDQMRERVEMHGLWLASPGFKRLQWRVKVVERSKAELLVRAIWKWSGDGCA